jgi:rhomboid protease GluP
VADAWVEVHRAANARGCDERLLVLEARGIPARLAYLGDYYAIEVAPENAPAASDELARYSQENRPRRRPRAPGLHGGAAVGALGYAALLVAVAAASTHGIFARDWYGAGILDATRVRAHEWWRAVTALTLHADLAHLAANVGFGLLFGIPLSRVLGPGLGWLAIAVAAISADLLDGLWMPDGQSALGASTAVFAALGLLASRGRAALGTGRGRAYRAAGLVAALVLLALLGTGDAHTDILAHALGFATGLGLGGILGRWPPPGGRRAQQIYGMMAFAAVLAAWVIALARAG